MVGDFDNIDFICIPIAAIALLLYISGARLRDRTARAGRSAWFPPASDARRVKPRSATLAYRMRHSNLAKGLKTAFAEGLSAALIVIGIYLLAIVLLNHLFLSYQQGAGNLCPDAKNKEFLRVTAFAEENAIITVSPVEYGLPVPR